MDLETWACPTCLSGLEETAEGLRCRSEGRVFPRRDGLPVLVRPEEEGLLADAEGVAARSSPCPEPVLAAEGAEPRGPAEYPGPGQPSKRRGHRCGDGMAL